MSSEQRECVCVFEAEQSVFEAEQSVFEALARVRRVKTATR